jgi:uncharacterized protein
MVEAFVHIAAAVDNEFERNRALHGCRMRCAPNCTECCHHRFEITDPEAAYVAIGLSRLEPSVRTSMEVRAQAYANGTGRLPCPALHEGVCGIYEHRPLICRKFGMPIYNPERPDRILACELNFRPGEEIRDPNLVRIQTSIHGEWREFVNDYYATGRYRHPERITVAEAILRAPMWYSGLDA